MLSSSGVESGFGLLEKFVAIAERRGLQSTSDENLKTVRRMLNGIGNESTTGALEKFVDAAARCGVKEQEEVAVMIMAVAMSRVGRRIEVFEKLIRIGVERSARDRAKTILLVGWRKGVPWEISEEIASFTQTFGSILLYEIASRALLPSPEGFLASSLLARVTTHSTLHPTILFSTLTHLTHSPALLNVKFNHLSVLIEGSQTFLASLGLCLQPLYDSLKRSLPSIPDPVAKERVLSILKKIEICL
eukprot:TRINITY_DN3610_c3_g1_i1.p1 TRINITY_DN3610_c3_g1~~TRINITY_DN3610_c3_g1_i1.p1  ORF type:complete len:247 (+),score=44.51 TRINITY_DN3610_c3_g1_i1:50-790(+)